MGKTLEVYIECDSRHRTHTQDNRQAIAGDIWPFLFSSSTFVFFWWLGYDDGEVVK